MLVPRLEIGGRDFGHLLDIGGIALFVVILILNWRQARRLQRPSLPEHATT